VAEAYHNRARWYSPEAGRFLTRDPIGYLGGVNQYMYANGNPIGFRDPWGLEGEKCRNWSPENNFGTDAYLGFEDCGIAGKIHLVLDSDGNPVIVPPGVNLIYNIHSVMNYNDLGIGTPDLDRFKRYVNHGGRWDYKRYDPSYEAFGNYNYAFVGTGIIGDDGTAVKVGGDAAHLSAKGLDFEREFARLLIESARGRHVPGSIDNPDDTFVIDRAVRDSIRHRRHGGRPVYSPVGGVK
jgi:uncharacterized protein RhaS with RHS repeats